VNISNIKRIDGPNSFRAKLGIAPQDFVVLYAGQIGPKQALHLLLEAALKCGDGSGYNLLWLAMVQPNSLSLRLTVKPSVSSRDSRNLKNHLLPIH
jgi:hypothetical protein